MAWQGEAPRAELYRENLPGLKVVTLRRNLAGGKVIKELSITALPEGENSFHTMFEKIHRVADRAAARIVAKNVFGIPARKKAGLDALREVWSGKVAWPVTWLDEGQSQGMALTGVHARAVAGAEPEPLGYEGRVVGTIYDDGFARHCCLGDLRGSDPSQSRSAQAEKTFSNMEKVLRSSNMKFSNVVRTWLYLDGILEWYAQFNEVRNSFFKERGVFEGLVPASTGIGGANVSGSMVVADAYAISPHEDSVKVFAVPSPLQCPALQYGSSFSRAVEIRMPDHRKLLISGTASIEAGGKTVHTGDIVSQIRWTLEVVGAILESRDMNWTHVSRAVAYVKNGRDGQVFRDYLAANSLENMPCILTENDICRDDLLFEIEVDAISTG